MDANRCELCGRNQIATTVHHLTPKEQGGTFLPTAQLCHACHKQIHALYTNKELAARMNRVDLLQKDEQIMKYIKWIRKQPATGSVRTRKSKNR
jgi:5-methylcytosine-specific restriction protein A